jgi:hypothetical protein
MCSMRFQFEPFAPEVVPSGTPWARSAYGAGIFFLHIPYRADDLGL